MSERERKRKRERERERKRERQEGKCVGESISKINNAPHKRVNGTWFGECVWIKTTLSCECGFEDVNLLQ